MVLPRLAKIALFLPLCCACASSPSSRELENLGPVLAIGSGSDTLPEARGLWTSRAYGSVIDVGPEGIARYEWDGETCFALPEDAIGATETLSLDYRHVRFLPGGAWAVFKILDDEDGGFLYRRSAALPDPCRKARDWSRAEILEYFIRLFRDHYAFFEERGIDWQAIAAEARGRVGEVRNDREFFDLMAGMIDGFSDSHTKLLATVDGQRLRQQDGQGTTLPMVRGSIGETAWLVGIIDQLTEEVLDPGAQHVGNQRIIWGTMNDGAVGYIQVFTMGGFSGDDIAADGFFEREVETLDTILAEAFAAFEGTEGLILDLSNNRGGIGEIATRLAGYFAPGPVTGFTTQVPRTRLEPEDVIIRPLPIRYSGPVHVLTSDVTVSGGEIATLAMRAVPGTVQAGTTTRGSFSTVFSKPLPNGWVVELSNEIYRSPDGVIVEERGLVPDIPLDVYPASDPVGGHGRAVRALADRIAPPGSSLQDEKPAP